MTGGYCKSCDAPRPRKTAEVNHVAHGIVALLTMGLWLIPWLLFAVAAGKKSCAVCGSTLLTGRHRVNKHPRPEEGEDAPCPCGQKEAGNGEPWLWSNCLYCREWVDYSAGHFAAKE